jgi:ATP-dependent protease ClpP protease subunit
MGKNNQRREWFRMEAPRTTVSGTSADVYVYDTIGGWFGGVDPQEFVLGLADLDVDQINLFVNSPGGDVYGAIAMTNALRRHPANITATVDGLAASAASFLITGADEIVMGQNSELMIHDAWGFAIGNAEDMRSMGDDLDRISQNIASMYAAQAGGTADDWRQIMLAETWYSADEAVTAGLADRVDGADAEDETDPEGAFDLSKFQFAGRSQAPKPPLERIAAMVRKTRRAEWAVHEPTITSPAVAALHTEDRPTQPEPGTTPQDAATEKEDAMPEVALNQAPAEQPDVNPEKFDYKAMAQAFRDALKGDDDTAPVFAASPGVPASFVKPKDEKKAIGFNEAMNIFAASKRGLAPKDRYDELKATLTDGAAVFDALTDIGLADATSGGLVNTNAPQWIGELLTRVQFAGIWENVSHDDLTSPVVHGFTLTTAPTGGQKGDAGAAVVSTGAKWSLVSVNAYRWAGADSFDRTPFDFGISASAMSSYFRAQLYNYFVARDAQLITAMTSGLTATAAGAVPANSEIDAVTNQLLDGIVNVLSQGGGLANLGVVPVALYKDLIKNSTLQAPAFLEIDLGAITEGEVDGKFIVRPDLTGTLTAGDVLVANGQAGVTGYELPGSPVRAEQLQVSIGNIDVGLFGYIAAIRAGANFFSLVSAAA